MRILDVFKKPEDRPGMGGPAICGGTDHSHDENAPAEIHSTDLLLFKIRTGNGLSTHFLSEVQANVYAAKTELGIFTYSFEPEPRYALLDANCDFLSRLDTLTKEQCLIQDNGQHSFTHGLPDDFGGAVDIRYASGEYISKSCNQSSVISIPADKAVRELFSLAFTEYPRVSLPDTSEIKAVEHREDSEFRHALLRLESTGDGAKIYGEAKYSTSDTVHQHEKELSASAFDRIREDAAKYCVFGLVGLEKYHPNVVGLGTSSLTYELTDGTRVTIPQIYGIPAGAEKLVSETKLYLDSLLK